MGTHGIGKIHGQEKNITTYNLARMNMLLHGVKDSEFEIFHGDTLLNEWDRLRETNPARMPRFDAVVANPPFSYRWEPSESLSEDVRFKNYGLAPKSAADFAFLLHGFHFLKQDGVMAIILPHGVLFINAAEHFEKGKRQNQLLAEHLDKIIDTYQFRKEAPRYARRVGMEEIEKNDFNLNISRYVSTAQAEDEIDLASVHTELVELEQKRKAALDKHNAFLKELGLPLLP